MLIVEHVCTNMGLGFEQLIGLVGLTRCRFVSSNENPFNSRPTWPPVFWYGDACGAPECDHSVTPFEKCLTIERLDSISLLQNNIAKISAAGVVRSSAT